MTPQEQVNDALLAAERSIREALALLDERQVTCAACLMTRWTDFEQHKQADALRAALSRCERTRAALKVKP